jgi:hypothetical protein
MRKKISRARKYNRENSNKLENKVNKLLYSNNTSFSLYFDWSPMFFSYQKQHFSQIFAKKIKYARALILLVII